MNKPKKKSNGTAAKAAPATDHLITITIDGQEIRAEPGRNLVDVANENGIFIIKQCPILAKSNWYHITSSHHLVGSNNSKC